MSSFCMYLCPDCGSTKVVLLSDQAAGMILRSPIEYNAFVCLRCAAVILTPERPQTLPSASKEVKDDS